MKTNEELQEDVQDAIKWEALLNAAEIGVTAKDGVITLTGVVNSFAKKEEAEEAAKNVAGVKVVVEKIAIQFSSSFKKTDGDIAKEIIEALTASWIPDNKVKVRVEDGWVTLEGELEWNFQKDEAYNSVRHLDGIKGVSNIISIKPTIQDYVEQQDIKRALARNWSIDSKDIQVKVAGNKVTLNGTVRSFYQKDEANRIAWNAPGVSVVDNELVIDYYAN